MRYGVRPATAILVVLPLLAAHCTSDEPPLAPETPDVAPDVRDIVFYSDRAAGRVAFDLWTMDEGGTVGSRLTSPGSCEGYDGGASVPRWSPDGRMIAFVDQDIFDGVYVMAADGTDCRRLFSDSRDALDLAWSPDGKRLAFCWTGTTDGISTLDVSNGAETVLASGLDIGQLGCGIDWSPDGAYLFFARTDPPLFGKMGIAAVDLGAGRVVALGGLDALLTDEGLEARDPALSRDGRYMALLADGGDLDFDLMIWDLFAGSVHRVDLGPLVFTDGPRFSPDGAEVVFEAEAEGPFHHLWIVRRDGTGLRRLTTGATNEGGPDWR